MRWPWQERRTRDQRTEDVVTRALVEVRALTAELHALARSVEQAGKETDV